MTAGWLFYFLILIKTDLCRLKNSILKAGRLDIVKSIFFILIAVIFILSEYIVSCFLFEHIMDQIHLEDLRYILLAKLLNMVFLVFALLLFYSSIVMAISIFFLSEELDLIHSRPVPRFTLYIYRFIETFIRSSWMFIAFGVPVFLAYGDVLDLGWQFVLCTIADIIPFLVMTTALGICAAILLILFFSPKRAQKALLIVGIVASVGLILIFRWMRPEQLIDPIGVEQLTFYLDTLRMPTIAWLPTTWAAETLSSFSGHGKQFFGKFLTYLWLTGFISLILTFLIFKLFWLKARSSGSGSPNDRSGQLRKHTKSSRFRMGFLFRDVLLFFRDAGQWSQIIVIGALIAIYVFNFKNLPYELYGFQYSMSYISIIASGLILSALLARFAYPAVSMEGQSIWILRSAPFSWSKYLWIKFYMFFLPTILIGTLLVAFSVVILDVSAPLMWRCIVVVIFISSGCTGLAIGLGAINPRFEIEDAARVAVSSGALIFMLSSLAYILAVVGIIVIPDVLQYFSIGWSVFRYLNKIDRTISWLIIVIITYIATMVPMRIGIRTLKLSRK